MRTQWEQKTPPPPPFDWWISQKPHKHFLICKDWCEANTNIILLCLLDSSKAPRKGFECFAYFQGHSNLLVNSLNLILVPHPRFLVQGHVVNAVEMLEVLQDFCALRRLSLLDDLLNSMGVHFDMMELFHGLNEVHIGA
jgi:hypothetical protein